MVFFDRSPSIYRKRFWHTREYDIFSVFYDDVYISSLSMTWFKVLIILGILALAMAIGWFFIDKKFVESRTSKSLVTETDELLMRSNNEDDHQKVKGESHQRCLELRTVTNKMLLDENYIRPYMSESNSETSQSISKSSTVEGQRSVTDNGKCKTCQIVYNLVEFRWPSGPLQVYLTGSFLGWTAKVVMSRRRESRESDSGFSVKFFLPQGHHEFKFLVEGVWRLSNEYNKTFNSLGEENNCIFA